MRYARLGKSQKPCLANDRYDGNHLRHSKSAAPRPLCKFMVDRSKFSTTAAAWTIIRLSDPLGQRLIQIDEKAFKISCGQEVAILVTCNPTQLQLDTILTFSAKTRFHIDPVSAPLANAQIPRSRLL